MNRLGVKALLWCALSALTAGAQTDTTLTYHVEVSANASSGDYAPLWFTANRNGLSSSEPNSAYLRAGLAYRHSFNRGWRIAAGLDLAGAVEGPSGFAVQQAYADVSWRVLNLSIGSKERAPLGKNPLLSSGGMVEGNNARPVPQVRVEIADYYTVPGTKGWFAFKGHVAYGRFADDRWQRNFARGNHQTYLEDVLYHSKALMFKVGNKDRFPLEAEVGMAMSAQFGGKRHSFSQKDGEWVEEVYEMPHGLKNYAKVFLAKTGGSDTPGGDQVNVEGNHLGSWNFALNYYWRDWKFRAYLEHYFDDHSQMVWEYGRWKDGQLGFDITFPKNRWISAVVWEAMSTKQQTGPILYDEFAGTLGYQVSANDNYYNNYCYQAWQHWGQGMGNPLLPGPIYNKDGKITFKSNRVRSHHLGFEGDPSPEWNYRVLISFARHWGTYAAPLDKQRKQFSSLYEITYHPAWANGWSATAGMGLDRGNYLGNSTGGILTIRKTGRIF